MSGYILQQNNNKTILKNVFQSKSSLSTESYNLFCGQTQVKCPNGALKCSALSRDSFLRTKKATVKCTFRSVSRWPSKKCKSVNFREVGPGISSGYSLGIREWHDDMCEVAGKWQRYCSKQVGMGEIYQSRQWKRLSLQNQRRHEMFAEG